MNTGPKSLEKKEKTNNPAKENNSECKELKTVNKDNEKVAPDLKSISAPKKLFMTSNIIPFEACPSPKSNNIESKIKFIITNIDFHKENKEKKEIKDKKNNPLLITKIKDCKFNIFNNYIIFNYI